MIGWLSVMKTQRQTTLKFTRLFFFNRPTLKFIRLNLKKNLLTHWSWVRHICIGDLDHHLFKKWHVAFSAPSHFLNQCWKIVNWSLGNKLQLNFNHNLNIFIQENEFENVVCEMVAICHNPKVLMQNNYDMSNKINVSSYYIWYTVHPIKIAHNTRYIP